MFFTIKNDFVIIRLRKKNNIFYVIRNVRYAIYGIGAKLNKISTFMDEHISHDVRMNIMRHKSVISWEYFKRLQIFWNTERDAYYIKRVFKRSPAYIFVKKCNAIGAFKEFGYPISPGQLTKCNTFEEVSDVILNK